MPRKFLSIYGELYVENASTYVNDYGVVYVCGIWRNNHYSLWASIPVTADDFAVTR